MIVELGVRVKFQVQVSPEDLHLVTEYCWNSSGRYVYCPRYSGKRKKKKHDQPLLHRAIMEEILGRKLEPTELVDHINRDGYDNRRENLRLANKTQNAGNATYNRNNTSGYKGVTKNGKGWVAQIKVNGKRKYLGTYAVKEDAARAYDKVALEHFGKYALLNFPGS